MQNFILHIGAKHETQIYVAFCQKLLVYEDEADNVKIIFNDIVEMAKLHYGTSAKPHEVINGRLIQTFKNAVENPE